MVSCWKHLFTLNSNQVDDIFVFGKELRSSRVGDQPLPRLTKIALCDRMANNTTSIMLRQAAGLCNLVERGFGSDGEALRNAESMDGIWLTRWFAYETAQLHGYTK